jgi:glycosyltransferase involved in cell wall biosynthesis
VTGLSSVTVCIPIFRPDREMLISLLNSIEDQDRVVDEIVIAIDEDSDGVVESALRAVEPSAPVKVVRNERALGMVGNWNACVLRSSSEYVLLMGQDDVLLPPALSIFERLTRNAPKDCSVFAGAESYINAAGVAVGSRSKSVKRSRVFVFGDYQCSPFCSVSLALVYGQVFADPCGLFFRRAVFDSVGGFDDRYGHAADLAFILRCAVDGGGVAVTSEFVAGRRLHDDNLTEVHVANGLAAHDRQQLLEEFEPWLEQQSLARGDLYRLGGVVVRRARARVLTHDLFDAVRLRSLRGTRACVVRILRHGLVVPVMRDVVENLGLVRPTGRSWVESRL